MQFVNVNCYTNINPTSTSLVADDNNSTLLRLDLIEGGVEGFVDNEETETPGLPQLYEFFVKYVRRIKADNHWKRTMKTNVNKVFFQLITPSDIAYITSVIKNGKPVWNKKKSLFVVDEEKKVEHEFTLGKGQKRTFGKSTWSKEGLKYYHKVENAWKESYADKAQMTALINGWERWNPEDKDVQKGKELLRTYWNSVGDEEGRRKEGFDDDNEGMDDDDGYHSDVYDILVDMPYKLDNENLKMITGGDDNGGEEQKEQDEVNGGDGKQSKRKRGRK